MGIYLDTFAINDVEHRCTNLAQKFQCRALVVNHAWHFGTVFQSTMWSIVCTKLLQQLQCIALAVNHAWHFDRPLMVPFCSGICQTTTLMQGVMILKGLLSTKAK